VIGAVAAAAALCLVVIALVVTNSGSSNSAAPQPSSATIAGAGPVPSVPAGYTQVFLDNFGGAAGFPPSELNWLYDIGTDWGNKQVEHDTNSTSNIYLDGHGNLVIQANKNSSGQWTSGRIESTRDDFIAPPGGKLEMTASLQQPDVPSAKGYWPAFWALGSPLRTGGQWPAIGELDMMEDVNGHNAASQTLHYTGGAPDTPLTPCPDKSTTCQTGFHTYTVIINRTDPNAESLQYLMDGKVEKTITEAQVGAGPWKAAIDHGFFMLLNLAIGGSFPDGDCHCTTPTSSTTSGGAMKVAYAVVYEQGTNSTPTAKTTATGQVTGFQSKCLSNMDSTNSAGNGTVLDTCGNSTGQSWQTYSDGTLRAQGGCLDLNNGKQSSATVAVWYPCTGEQSQVWQQRSNGELYNPYSSLCLTAQGDNTTPLQIESCTDTPQQQWHLPT
jgi:beta-glucanase (GH16 family)